MSHHQASILNSINKEMEKKYTAIEDKINRLTSNQTMKLNTNRQFYPRVVNETAIKFSDEQMTLLNKGLKYNLSHKRKHWLSKKPKMPQCYYQHKSKTT